MALLSLNSVVSIIFGLLLLPIGIHKLGPYPSAEFHKELKTSLNMMFPEVWDFSPINLIIKSGDELALLVGVTEFTGGVAILLTQILGLHLLKSLIACGLCIPITCAIYTHLQLADNKWQPAAFFLAGLSLILITTPSTGKSHGKKD
mmetsp:Transcript_16109/g.24295  ORF Transcript_16109/g.24295 Transcript_16109/m.24295 type:complete len:147 (-) Transcript_16109:27-467(-)